MVVLKFHRQLALQLMHPLVSNMKGKLGQKNNIYIVYLVSKDVV